VDFLITEHLHSVKLLEMRGKQSDQEHSETSTLLSKGNDESIDSDLPEIEPGIGYAPQGIEGAQGYGTIVHADQNEEQEQASSDTEEADVEQQASHEDRTNQYTGLPEVKKKMIYIFPAIAIGVFLSAADQTLIVSSYGIIGTDLNALNKTSWIATAYFLTLTSFQPLYGKLSDVFGRKHCLLFAYIVFGLGCLFCGLAQNINQLIAARAFAGIGGGGMTTVVSILLSDVVTLRERGKWQGYVNIIYASGAGAGAPLGGLLADTVGWRVGFIAQAPMCLLAFIAVAAILHLPKQDASHWRDKLRKIDFLGASILVLGVSALLFGLDRGSNTAWRDKYTLAALCVCVPLFVLFVFIEMKIASEPFAPGHIIFNRSLFACYLCNFFSFGGWLAAIFYIPLYFQAVESLTATQAGIRLIPCIVCGVCGSLFGGFYMQRTGKYYWITLICYSTLVLGLVFILLFSGVVVNSVPGLIVGTMISGFSNGVGVTTSLIGLSEYFTA
jgi:MFS family permease